LPTHYENQTALSSTAIPPPTGHPSVVDVYAIDEDIAVYQPGQLLMTANPEDQDTLNAEIERADSPYSHHIGDDADVMQVMIESEAATERQDDMSEERQSLLSLPRQVMQCVLRCLSLEDVFHLGITCKKLLYLLTDDIICQSVLQVSKSDSAFLSCRQSSSSHQTAEFLDILKY
jgi:hypothetical protein